MPPAEDPKTSTPRSDTAEAVQHLLEGSIAPSEHAAQKTLMQLADPKTQDSGNSIIEEFAKMVEDVVPERVIEIIYTVIEVIARNFVGLNMVEANIHLDKLRETFSIPQDELDTFLAARRVVRVRIGKQIEA